MDYDEVSSLMAGKSIPASNTNRRASNPRVSDEHVAGRVSVKVHTLTQNNIKRQRSSRNYDMQKPMTSAATSGQDEIADIMNYYYSFGSVQEQIITYVHVAEQEEAEQCVICGVYHDGHFPYGRQCMATIKYCQQVSY